MGPTAFADERVSVLVREENMATGNSMEAGVVFDMVDLANYQSGSIVSRTMVDKPTGTVTFFAFDREQGLSEHQAPFDALVFVIEGTASVSVAGRPHEVKGGQAIVLPANIPHALKAATSFKMLLTMIKQ